MVETSITADSSLESTSFSIDCPPVPVAWKTRQSCSPSSWRDTAWTQGVVTPNIVSPMAGRVSAADLSAAPALSADQAIMPASACAALDSTRAEMRLMPETSVTEYIMQMSDGPT